MARARCSLAIALSLAVMVVGSAVSPRRPLHHEKNRASALSSVKHFASRATRNRQARAMAGWSAPAHLTASPPYVIYPGDFGADPTGKVDSTVAFAAAIAALLSRNTSGHEDEGGSIDLGGALLDLEGGDYLISAPLTIPTNYSNCAIVHGSLRASSTFPPGAFLIEVGTPSAPCSNWGDSCNEDVSVEDLFLDGSQVAAGCMRFTAVIGVNAGPDIFCVNFTVAGIDIEGGHEVMLHESWIGSCWYTPPGTCWLNATALGQTTGILINGNDHILDNVVVFAGLTGVSVLGAANVISATHTWNTQSGAVPTAVGIEVTSWQNRLVAPYLDYVPLVCRGCAVTTVTNGFFLGGAQILFSPDPHGYPVRGVFISGNEFAGLGDGQSDILALPPPNGGANYSGVQDVTVIGSCSDNSAAVKRSTTATLTSTGTPPWVFDFTDRLIFDADVAPIRSVLYSVTSIDGSFFQHHALPAQGLVVTVVADVVGLAASVNATVTCSVDQSERL